MEDLLQLSDEYQVTQLIFNPCVKFLEDQPKTRENVMRILSLANLYNLEKVHQGCIDLLKNMRLESLSKTVHLPDLDKEKTQYYLTQRIERLEAVIDGVCPQMYGLVFSLVCLLHDSEDEDQLQWCRKHVSGGTFSLFRPWEIKECIGCRGMLKSMVDATCFMKNGKQMPRHRRKAHFDNNLFSVMDDLYNYMIEKN